MALSLLALQREVGFSDREVFIAHVVELFGSNMTKNLRAQLLLAYAHLTQDIKRLAPFTSANLTRSRRGWKKGRKTQNQKDKEDAAAKKKQQDKDDAAATNYGGLSPRAEAEDDVPASPDNDDATAPSYGDGGLSPLAEDEDTPQLYISAEEFGFWDDAPVELGNMGLPPSSSTAACPPLPAFASSSLANASDASPHLCCLCEYPASHVDANGVFYCTECWADVLHF